MRASVRFALVPVAALVLSACGLQEGLDQRPDSGGANPSQAPSFSGTTLNGTALTWASLRDHVVVLDFWASWCGPCRAEQSDINKLYQEYASRGVVFLGIDMRDDHAAALAYQRDQRVAYASIADSAEQVSAAYNVSAPPTMIIIDKHGVITRRLLGTV